MTPTEATTILRRYNAWRRGEDETQPMPDPREIGLAIDAAVEMIERLEAAEKSDAESLAMYRKARDERDALRAKIAEMEKQSPVGWLLDGDFYEVRQMSLYKDNEPLPGQTALYTLPGAQEAKP